jgi:nicotinamide riboside kinase
LKAKHMMSKGNDYRTVAVIGCQSSGKSKIITN